MWGQLFFITYHFEIFTVFPWTGSVLATMEIQHLQITWYSAILTFYTHVVKSINLFRENNYVLPLYWHFYCLNAPLSFFTFIANITMMAWSSIHNTETTTATFDDPDLIAQKLSISLLQTNWCLSSQMSSAQKLVTPCPVKLAFITLSPPGKLQLVKLQWHDIWLESFRKQGDRQITGFLKRPRKVV